MGATQELAQRVCQRYGWSAQFEKDDAGFWFVDVTVGLNDTRRFVSEDRSSDSTKGRKQGINAASEVALEGLQEEIQRQEAKPKMELSQIFPDEISVYESSVENWDYFWKHKPKVVGIDTEGNQKAPPVLVQISTDDYAILETPRERLSRNLERLLADTTVIKVFCDNNSHHDKKSLGLEIPADLTMGPIVDLESIASKLLGHVKTARGLSRMITFSMPELDVLIEKTAGRGTTKNKRFLNIGRFALIGQGKAPPLRGLDDLSKKEQQYAALDAWCTLQAYKRLQEAATLSLCY